MDITNFFKVQKNITNNRIIDESLSEYKVFARKHLQLHIKMSDLANETKCSTYWINDTTTFNKKSTFNKYITCLREIISLALDNDYENLSEIEVIPSEYCLSDQFLNLYIDINDLVMSSSLDHFVTILEDFLSLGLSLGFTEKDIEHEFCNNIDNIEMAL